MTPKTRDRETRRPDAKTAILTLDCHTAKMLQNDVKGRVAAVELVNDDTAVSVILSADWKYTGEGNSQVRDFTLWEAARNAVRRAVEVNPS